MIDINLKYHVALIGNYEDISPKPETIKFFIDAFADKELIPSTFQEAGITGMLNRFSLKSSNDIWTIEFSTNRIDIQKYNNDLGNEKMDTLQKFILDAKNIITIIDEKFSRKHSRIGLTSQFILKKMNKEEINNIFLKNVNTTELYSNNEPVEWNNRVVTRINFDLKSQELVNVISEINRIDNSLILNSNYETINRIELKFDVNTFQGNQEFRFDLEETKLFLDKAFELQESLKIDYLKLIS